MIKRKMAKTRVSSGRRVGGKFLLLTAITRREAIHIQQQVDLTTDRYYVRKKISHAELILSKKNYIEI